MEVDFLVFGHGHDGDLRSDDYDGSEFVEYLHALRVAALRHDEPRNYQQAKWEKFRVIEHVSAIDHKTYLLAVADGHDPQGVDIKIMQEGPRPKPSSL